MVSRSWQHVWDEAVLQSYITNQVQESLNLEYKQAASLDKADQRKKDEITKDVSAMANSDGGILIYGVAEHQQSGTKHLPEKLDPVDLTQVSKEWLEQIINTIRPRIDGVIIHPVPLSSAPHHVAYVVEIPQSATAHQARDHRYYKRFNFLSVPMEDYEIRDIMGRIKHPKIEPEFEVIATTALESTHIDPLSQLLPSLSRSKQPAAKIEKTHYRLNILARNNGSVYAQYVRMSMHLPLWIIPPGNRRFYLLQKDDNGEKYLFNTEENTVREVVDTEQTIIGSIKKYGPARYSPVLPGLSHSWSLTLADDYEKSDLNNFIIRWETYADNAPPAQGAVRLSEIPISRRRPEDDDRDEE